MDEVAQLIGRSDESRVDPGQAAVGSRAGGADRFDDQRKLRRGHIERPVATDDLRLGNLEPRLGGQPVHV